MPISESTQNTCKGFLSLQNGLSVWFTRLHNHGEDCWSDSCPEDNHWHPSQGGEDTNIHYQRICSQSAVSKHVNRKLSGRKKCGRFGTCPHCRKRQKHLKLVKWPCVGVLDWPANSPDLNIIYGVLLRGKWETRDQKMQMSWRPLSKKPGLHTTSAVPQTDLLHATPNWASN